MTVCSLQVIYLLVLATASAIESDGVGGTEGLLFDSANKKFLALNAGDSAW